MAMFGQFGKEYNNEQDIIDAGVQVIYWYCREVRGGWRAIEHLMVEDAGHGYYYARNLVKERYEPTIEAVYLMKHSGVYLVDKYMREFVRYGNV